MASPPTQGRPASPAKHRQMASAVSLWTASGKPHWTMDMSRGFGFFANFFSMRKLARKRQTLDEEQAAVAARIEGLRARWQAADQEHATAEAGRRTSWVELETEAAALSAKIDAVRAARTRMVVRSTVERVLTEQVREVPESDKEEQFCPRCNT